MGNWRQLAALPAPREAAAAVFHSGKVYVFGGAATSDGAFTNTTYIYDPTGNTWTTGALMPTGALCYAFSTAADGVHVVFPATGAHYAYDPDTNTWATRTAVPGPGRAQTFHFTDADGLFYLAGGQALSGGESLTVQRYDPDTDGWASRADLPGGGYASSVTGAPGVVGNDGKVYIGRGAFQPALAVYDPGSDGWTTAPAMPDARPFYPTVSKLPGGTIITLPHRSTPSGGGTPQLMRRIDGYTPGSGWEMGVAPDYPGGVHAAAVATEPGGVIYLLGGTFWDSGAVPFAVADCWAYKQNEPPSVATLLTMTGGVLVSTAVRNRARHQFNDVNAGDSQSKFLHRHRKVGDTAWITVEVVSPNPWYDFPAGSLEPGDYERQVLPSDAAGEPAPAYTPSGLFTAADPPAGPVITYPINGQILDQVEYVEWSAPSQQSYQLRRVADSAGAPNTAVVYFDTGEVVDTLTRKIPVTFETNNRDEHVQVRIKDGGLWSVWDSVGGTVSYTPPPTPSFTTYTDPSTGSLLIMIATPDPAPGDPAAVSTRVYITEPLPSGRVVEERRAIDLPTNTAWRYWDPVGSWNYAGRIRVEAVASNGTTASST